MSHASGSSSTRDSYDYTWIEEDNLLPSGAAKALKALKSNLEIANDRFDYAKSLLLFLGPIVQNPRAKELCKLLLSAVIRYFDKHNNMLAAIFDPDKVLNNIDIIDDVLRYLASLSLTLVIKENEDFDAFVAQHGGLEPATRAKEADLRSRLKDQSLTLTGYIEKSSIQSTIRLSTIVNVFEPIQQDGINVTEAHFNVGMDFVRALLKPGTMAQKLGHLREIMKALLISKETTQAMPPLKQAQPDPSLAHLEKRAHPIAEQHAPQTARTDQPTLKQAQPDLSLAHLEKLIQQMAEQHALDIARIDQRHSSDITNLNGRILTLEKITHPTLLREVVRLIDNIVCLGFWVYNRNFLTNDDEQTVRKLKIKDDDYAEIVFEPFWVLTAPQLPPQHLRTLYFLRRDPNNGSKFLRDESGNLRCIPAFEQWYADFWTMDAIAWQFMFNAERLRLLPDSITPSPSTPSSSSMPSSDQTPLRSFSLKSSRTQKVYDEHRERSLPVTIVPGSLQSLIDMLRVYQMGNEVIHQNTNKLTWIEFTNVLKSLLNEDSKSEAIANLVRHVYHVVMANNADFEQYLPIMGNEIPRL